MKVYCLLITQTSDMEVFVPRIPIVSEDKDKVLKAFKEFVENEKKEMDDELNGGSWVIANDTDEWFEAYEDGRYVENHVEASVLEKELDVLDWSC